MWIGLLLASSSPALQAQSPSSSQAHGWQPNRLPNSSSMQPLAAAGAASTTRQTNSAASVNNASAADQGDSGVVLRWRTSPRVGNTQPVANGQAGNSYTTANQAVAPAASTSMAARVLDSNTLRSSSASEQPVQPAQYTTRATTQASGNQVSGTNTGRGSGSTAANPLRSTASDNARAATGSTGTFMPRGTVAGQRSAVQPANFQAPVGNVQLGNAQPGNAIVPPNFPVPNNVPNLQAPPAIAPPNFPNNAFPQDALNVPEDAPAPPIAPPVQDEFPKTPGLGAPPAQDINPAAPMPGADNELQLQDRPADGGIVPPRGDDNDPFKNRVRDELESPSDRESARRSRELEKQRDLPDSTANCESFRDKLRNSSIQKINLNAAPRYGQGMNDDPDKSEKQRLDFAASSEVRSWCDRSGRTVIQGRMIDLINEQVVLDVNGVRREVPLRDLCDVDLAYVGKVWHLPVSCGSGDEQLPGRSFVPSAIQWKASGLCHKPLYFEEVQLERYGHEIGPILQPLVSTAHFFGNIAVLPYKMGIHPPHECQYALGYYRPGDCAPYMLPPVPISLRGAAVQAGAVVGGAALLP